MCITQTHQNMNTAKTITQLETQVDAVIYFFQKLDAEMVGQLLDNDRTYQDYPKPIFIEKLQVAMDGFIESGDTELISYAGFCNAELCNYGCRGYAFVGNHSRDYMPIIVDQENGKVLDLYECCTFKLDQSDVTLKDRVVIDRLEIYPF